MEIRSKLPYPSGALSNFAAYRFWLDGVLCESMEGFLQSLLEPDLESQERVCRLIGIEAKKFGLERIEAWQQGDRKVFWRGQAYDRHAQEYQDLLDRAYSALFEQNESYRKALWDTGNEPLTHPIGVQDPNEDILTEKEFCDRLMRLRDRVLETHKCTCPCHHDRCTIHFQPCCGQCTICGLLIKPEKAKEHLRICHDTHIST